MQISSAMCGAVRAYGRWLGGLSLILALVTPAGAFPLAQPASAPWLAQTDAEPSAPVDCGSSLIASFDAHVRFDPDVSEVTSEQSAEQSSVAAAQCFADHFTDCAPAMVDEVIPSFATYQYEILGAGPDGNLCAVRSQFLVNPNPKFMDKDMTCLYDNTLEFTEALDRVFPANLSSCSGPLRDLFMT